LDDLNQNLEQPGRLIGLHFFNPVSRMPLVEVVSGLHTNPILAEKLLKFALKLDKFPLPVESAPGFLVNRILMPYLLEAILMVEEGIPPAAIDKAAKDFGMPMGPLELLDTVGLDVAVFATESLKTHFPEVSIPKLAKQYVSEGRLGKKTGRGFYRYKNGKMLAVKVDPTYRLPEDSLDRLILRMVNESVACLREGIVKNADLVDAGMIFGTGFPPFRGGPMHYAAEQGEPLLIQRLNLLAQRYGNRFLPDAGW
jgi:3-hydroxyacyl-CoA dehydrogenase/enoyl-CoA hydratase/3-hydroxybutyryl-CoA epimerase